MLYRIFASCISIALFLFFVGLSPTPVRAGLFDKVGDALGSAADKFSKDVKEAGQELGVVDKEKKSTKESKTTKDSQAKTKTAKTEKLPSGVVYRLKKIGKELDRADKAMDKGVGSASDRAGRAERYLKSAKRYRSEIDKNYKGKFSADHPDITACDDRILKLEQNIAQAQGGKSAPVVAEKAGEQKTAAKSEAEPAKKEKKVEASAKLPSSVKHRLKKAAKELDRAEKAIKAEPSPGSVPADVARKYFEKAKYLRKEIDDRYAGKYSLEDPMVKSVDQRIASLQAQLDKADQAKAADKAAQQKAEAQKKAGLTLCNEWNDKLKPFISPSSGKELLAYHTDDSALIREWKGIYSEVEPLWKEYQSVEFSQDKTPDLKYTEKELGRRIGEFKDVYAKWEKKASLAKANMGGFMFSTAPIDPAAPGGFTDNFKAGDNIYALVKVKKPWAKIYKNQNKASLRINVKLDNKKIHAQFVTLKTPAELNKDYILFEIAPAPDKTKAYANPNIEYGKSTPTLRQGPMELSHHLGKLGPGNHTMSFDLYYYGKTWAKGSFKISGDDFGYYAKLNQEVAGAVAKARTLPKAKMKNAKFESQMKKILEEAGWPEVYRLNIVDKDWWLDRVSGGDSPVKSRHMAAAALAKGSDGKYFYRVCTFHQHKLLSGGFGKFELSHQGPKVPIAEANIDK